MQQRKNVIFIADSLDNAHKFQAVLSSLDVDVAAGSSMQFKKLLADNPSYDLVIYEATAESAQTLIAVEQALIDDHHREGGHAFGLPFACPDQLRFCCAWGKLRGMLPSHSAAIMARERKFYERFHLG